MHSWISTHAERAWSAKRSNRQFRFRRDARLVELSAFPTGKISGRLLAHSRLLARQIALENLIGLAIGYGGEDAADDLVRQCLTPF